MLNVLFHQRVNHLLDQICELLKMFVVLFSVSVTLIFLSVFSLISFPGFDLRSARVVSLATGTKCLDFDSVSDRGGTLSDCHAEVVSRRALVRFLYAQLELLLWYDPEEYSLFISCFSLCEVFSF